jgi:pyridinium-3,5-biscarboxylic acid mononucleotide sulfurtransferase
MTTTTTPTAGTGTNKLDVAAIAERPGLDARRAALEDRLRSLPSLIVAYSGGVDSAFLAWAATQHLGDRALCITAESASYPERHRAMALAIARDFGLHHEIVATGELERAEYRANAPDRCYYCKHELYTRLTAIARDRGIAVVADGSNTDDRGDYRPGRRAAREFGVISPLDEAGLSKDDIRALSLEAGLPTWDEPASACLSSRIPYFSEVTNEKLRAIEQAEDAVRALGFRVVRVRHHDQVARLELDVNEMARAIEPETAAAITRAVVAAGFRFVALDLKGYRLGSLNEGVRLRPV